MRNLVWSLLLGSGLLLCLSGCFFQSAEELYALPKPSDLYVNLQGEIRRVMGNAEYTAPLTGSNTQTIQLVDLNGDGIKEAVAFFRDDTQEKPLKIYIFAQNDQGDYEEYTHIEGAATDVESINYVDLGGDQDLEIVVSWQVSASVHTLVAYGVEKGRTAELARSSYGSYLATDMDLDGKNELLLIQTDSPAPESGRVELLAYRDGAMELVSTAPLSQRVGEVLEFQAGFLSEGQPAFFVTSGYQENRRITDIFTWNLGRLRNITIRRETGQSTGTLREYTGVPVQDIDGDGISEIPVTQKIHSAETPTPSENFWAIDWWQYAADGSARLQMTTYHNNKDGWYFELPQAWGESITLGRQENTVVGERAVVFSHWEGDPAEGAEPFLVIYRLTGTSRKDSDKRPERFVIWSEEDATYVGELLDSQWDSGLTQDDVLRQFHLIQSGDWT